MKLEPPQDPPARWEGLRALHGHLQALRPQCVGDLEGPANRGLQLLERDLLEREHSEVFVVGIVGPNNAGKSAVFNGLCQERVSPSRPTGGATRRLCAATHSIQGWVPRGFESIERVDRGPGELEQALAVSHAKSLLAIEVPSLPKDLLLVDAPDFDSILEGHKESAEVLCCAWPTWSWWW